MKIEKVLTNLSEKTKGNLKCSVASIHKIKHDENFNELVSKNDKLKDASYVVYSNYNQIRESEFLDARGGLVATVKELHPNLIYENLDFEIGHYDIVDNHPFDESLHDVSAEELLANVG